MTGTCPEKIRALIPDPLTISARCPRKPKPVTSVQALTSKADKTRAASRFNVAIRCVICAVSQADAISALMAVLTIPAPSGLVSKQPVFASQVFLGEHLRRVDEPGDG